MKNDILKKYSFYGISTALLTPFIGEKIDYYSLEKIVTANIRAGVCAFVLFGSTSEHFSLTDDEKKQINNVFGGRKACRFLHAFCL